MALSPEAKARLDYYRKSGALPDDVLPYFYQRLQYAPAGLTDEQIIDHAVQNTSRDRMSRLVGGTANVLEAPEVPFQQFQRQIDEQGLAKVALGIGESIVTSPFRAVGTAKKALTGGHIEDYADAADAALMFLPGIGLGKSALSRLTRGAIKPRGNVLRPASQIGEAASPFIAGDQEFIQELIASGTMEGAAQLLDYRKRQSAPSEATGGAGVVPPLELPGGNPGATVGDPYTRGAYNQGVTVGDPYTRPSSGGLPPPPPASMPRGGQGQSTQPTGATLYSDPFSAAFQLLPSLFARATSSRPGPDPSNPSLPSLTENTFDYMLRISRLYELSETANVAFHEVLDNLETNEGFEWGERATYLQEFEQGATPGFRAREFMNEVSERGVAAAIRALDRRINAPLTEAERQRMMDSARDDSMQRQAERAVGRRPAETPAGIEIPQGRGESGVAAAPTGPDQPSAFGTPQTETDVDTSDIDDLLREIEELTDDNDGGTTLYSDPFSAAFQLLPSLFARAGRNAGTRTESLRLQRRAIITAMDELAYRDPRQMEMIRLAATDGDASRALMEELRAERAQLQQELSRVTAEFHDAETEEIRNSVEGNMPRLEGTGESGIQSSVTTGRDEPTASQARRGEVDTDTSDIDDLLREIEELTDDGGTTLYSDPFVATFDWAGKYLERHLKGAWRGRPTVKRQPGQPAQPTPTPNQQFSQADPRYIRDSILGNMLPWTRQKLAQLRSIYRAGYTNMERIGEVGDELAKKLQIYLELKPRQFSGHELRQIQPFFQQIIDYARTTARSRNAGFTSTVGKMKEQVWDHIESNAPISRPATSKRLPRT